MNELSQFDENIAALSNRDKFALAIGRWELFKKQAGDLEFLIGLGKPEEDYLTFHVNERIPSIAEKLRQGRLVLTGEEVLTHYALMIELTQKALQTGDHIYDSIKAPEELIRTWSRPPEPERPRTKKKPKKPKTKRRTRRRSS